MKAVTAPLTAELSRWVATLGFDRVPARVRARLSGQVLSVLAAAHAARHSAPARAVLAMVEAHGAPGRLPVVPTGVRRSLADALLGNAACGMALDYDDYLFMGHTGHSAIWVPLLLGAELAADPREVVCAMAAANEVAGRLGAACLLGPQNGQLWSFIHLAGAACAASRLLGLDPARTADALGIALAQPNYGLFPGFLGPGSKLLTAATPAIAGVQAARLAAAGLTGCRTVLEDPRGFLRHFAFRPLPQMLSGWGEAWVTETLAVKPYPGCAYVDTAIDALREILAAEPVDPREVERVVVQASLLTVEMDRLGREQRGRLSSASVAFDLGVAVAVTLLDGDLTARGLADERLAAERAALLDLAGRVRVEHDWRFTADTIVHLAGRLGPDRLAGNLGLWDWLAVRRRSRELLGPGALDLGLREGLRLHRELPAVQRARLRGLLFRRLAARPGGAPSLAGADMGQVGLPFGARVSVGLRSGRTITREKLFPRGSPLAGDLDEVAREKWRREAIEPLGAARTARVEALAADLARTPPGELLEAAAREG